jgi:hypothetical protein
MTTTLMMQDGTAAFDKNPCRLQAQSGSSSFSYQIFLPYTEMKKTINTTLIVVKEFACLYVVHLHEKQPDKKEIGPRGGGNRCGG